MKRDGCIFRDHTMKGHTMYPEMQHTGFSGNQWGNMNWGHVMAHIEDVSNDDLIYVNVREFTHKEYKAEIDRCAEIIESHCTTGIDLTYWYDRENHLREMAAQLSQVMAYGGI